MHNANDITMRPVATVLELSFTADELLRALLTLAPERRAQILDSGGARGVGEARFLIAGFDPFETIEARGEELLIERRGEGAGRVERGSLLSLLDERLARYRVGWRLQEEEEAASQLPVAGGACIA
ncbi:MAG TPA: hypothetical protein VGA87_00850, partial [Pyrinomonadaceae bacterium]